LITEVCEAGGSFPQKVNRLYERLMPWDVDTITARLRAAGVIPEMYAHDSSEEKVYAKYCDIVVSEAFRAMGFQSAVSNVRSNAADLCIDGPGYSSICDVKSFRLSRTALNPKDYKIEAVDRWRRNQEADYAFLVAPHTQFPGGNSRLYDEAIRYNVTLLSFAHVDFLVRTARSAGQRPYLRLIWQVGETIPDPAGVRGPSYWKAVDAAVVRASGGSESALEEAKHSYEEEFQNQARLQVKYWEDRLQEIRNMPREQLIDSLVRAEGIESKIQTIRQYLR
jgi:hypothetical protein